MSEHPLKQACALARALMPLEIEGAASEESARYVKEHISACTDCAIAYGEEKQRQRVRMTQWPRWARMQRKQRGRRKWL